MNKIRVGKFTSSTIGDLMTKNRKGDDFGAPGIKLIKEKRWERGLGRSVDTEQTSRITSWGQLMERWVARHYLDFDAEFQSQTTLQHPEYGDFWCGSPDYLTSDAVGDIKCPWNLRYFCGYVDAINNNSTEELREAGDGEKYYWQLVSNAIIAKKEYAELLVFCPFRDELDPIRKFTQRIVYEEEGDAFQYRFIIDSFDIDLPFLIKEGNYINVNKIRFRVPDLDKAQLTTNVLVAASRL